MIYINYSHYKVGIYNLCTVTDGLGRFASSLKGKETALKNFARRYGKVC